MAARAIGSVTLSFGLVSIPVKVYSSGVTDKSVSFNMLERETGARVKQQYISSVSGDVVPRSEMVKGYEFSKGQYVIFDSDELKSFEQEANKAVEIKEFVPLSAVDPLHFEKAYYVGPDKGADRPYRLLCAAMNETGRGAVAKYAARGKQYLVLLRPFEDGIVMQQMRYSTEIRAIDDVPLGEATDVDANELKLAVQLVEQIANDEFDSTKYVDEVKERILAAIQSKVEGQEITAEPAGEPKAKVIDLMEALKASVAGAGDEAKPAAKRKPAKRAAKKKTTKKAGKRKAE